MKDRETLTGFLGDHGGKKPISFHMPGHKGRPEVFRYYGQDFVDRLVQGDITEIPGADALQQPDGIIKDLMDAYARHYHAKHTEILVNGSTAGIMAAIMTSVPRGGSLIMGRSSHKSAYSALRLGDIRPVYVESLFDEEYFLQGGISPEAIKQAVEEHPEASAVFVTSPNYYGVLSDIGKIAEFTHDAGMILIVDQAHGAHLVDVDLRQREMERKDPGGYREAPAEFRSAEFLGADITINSIHKSLFGFTGTGVLNICTEVPDVDRISGMLGMLQTTSPSYILMESLDASLQIMEKHGPYIVDRWRDDLDTFYEEAEEIAGLTVVMKDRRTYDRTKINLSFADKGVRGSQLWEDLIYRNIWPEMVHGDYVLLLTGAGNRSEDYLQLLRALREISEDYGIVADPGEREKPFSGKMEQRQVPAEAELIPIYQAEGRVLYDPIIPYPPGVPLACPGEVLSYQAISYIGGLLGKGDQLMGVDDEGLIKVGKEV